MSSITTITTHEDQLIAKRSLKVIHRKNNPKRKLRRGKTVQLKIKGSEEPITIPKSAFDFLVLVLEHMANGKNITLFNSESELTTQQAADLLNVSRPHLVKVLENGEIPFTKVGRHRRIKSADLYAYSQKQQVNREEALDSLAKQAQDLNLGY